MGIPILIGTDDNGITDNASLFNRQLMVLAAAGGGFVRLPGAASYYGVGAPPVCQADVRHLR